MSTPVTLFSVLDSIYSVGYLRQVHDLRTSKPCSCCYIVNLLVRFRVRLSLFKDPCVHYRPPVSRIHAFDDHVVYTTVKNNKNPFIVFQFDLSVRGRDDLMFNW